MDLPKHIIVCDIEGTVADHRHRLHFAYEKRWDEFFSRLDQDIFRTDVWRQVTSYKLPVVFVTGIPENFRKKLELWLKQNNAEYVALIMKSEGDYRRSEVVKEEIYEQYLRQTDIEAVFEDLDEVIQMWRGKGLTVFNVRIKEE